MQFDCAARDYCAARIMAHEYLDDDAVLKEKVAKLAGLVRRSHNMLAFTGAGISTAAGIDDYASKAKTSSVTAAGKPVVKDWKDAQPTLAHRALAALHAAGHLKHWIQQNHDSLPQKAGYPQHALNEIHGSLHDPANPIVPYEGSLRDDLYAWMQEWEARQDLCLALGTSLSGFNVDRVAESASDAFAQGRGLGLVIVNLQATPYDAGSALRIWARIDDVMSLLAAELGIEPAPPPTQDAPPPLPSGAHVAPDVLLVPFDAAGTPTRDGSRTRWDLSVGRRVRLTGGPYEGDEGTVVEKSAAGHYRIRFEDSIHPTFKVKRRPFSLWLGSWWLTEAAAGFGITPGGRIPVVNVQ